MVAVPVLPWAAWQRVGASQLRFAAPPWSVSGLSLTSEGSVLDGNGKRAALAALLRTSGRPVAVGALSIGWQ
eukprot:14217733-Alexandrium_andersonii.AAC.1